MDQPKLIDQIAAWLRCSLEHSDLEVKCDHATAQREEPAIYIDQKLPGQGRRNRIKQLDIAVVDKNARQVKLVIEVDPSNEPVVPLGVVLAVILGDVYVPSHQYSPAGDYRIHDCVVIYLTVIKQGQASKCEQLLAIQRAVAAKLDLCAFGIKALHLCHGQDDEDALRKCRDLLRQYLPIREQAERLTSG